MDYGSFADESLITDYAAFKQHRFGLQIALPADDGSAQFAISPQGTLIYQTEPARLSVSIMALDLATKEVTPLASLTLGIIDGVLETDGEVHHLIAYRVHDFSELAGHFGQRLRRPRQLQPGAGRTTGLSRIES